jgi:hypothetical protein
VSGPHVVNEGGALVACLLPDGHTGPHSTVEPEPQPQATVVLPQNMGGWTLYLWPDGMVTWRNRRPSR